MDKNGLLLCARYCAPPNFFGYCGPGKTASIIDHLKEDVVDAELTDILSDFETLYPYLQLIARKNKIIDPFDKRVVEAYWIGNEFLKPLTVLEHEAFAQEKLFLGKKLERKNLINLKLKIKNLKFFPHHSFHVFNIFRRTGHNPSFHTSLTMDECRVGWGIITNIKNLLIKTNPLLTIGNKLRLGESVLKKVKVDYKGKQFIKDLRVGDWISFHWGFICDILTPFQVKNLEYYTQKAIDFYNQ